MNVYQLNRPDIAKIIDYCLDLESGSKLEVYEFGKNCDLVLHIYKDEDYNPDQDKDAFNIVRIHTAQNGVWVDDTEDIHVNHEHILRQELERLNHYKDFGTI